MPGARADSLGLRWEEKLDRDMGIFMNQIILDQNWEKLMGSLYSLGNCGCVPTAYSSKAIRNPRIHPWLFIYISTISIPETIYPISVSFENSSFTNSSHKSKNPLKEEESLIAESGNTNRNSVIKFIQREIDIIQREREYLSGVVIVFVNPQSAPCGEK